MNTAVKTSAVKIFQYACAVAAYAFLAYKLVRFDGYAELADYFRHLPAGQYAWLLAMLVLWLANIGIEVAKWRFTLSAEDDLPFALALKSVLAGWVTAFVTPNRIGEFPGRAVYLSKAGLGIGKSTVLGWIGAAASMAVTVLCGLPACVCLLDRRLVLGHPAAYVGGCATLLLVLCLCIFCLPRIAAWLLRKRNWKPYAQDMLDSLSHLRPAYMLTVFAWSLLRYAVFCTQFWVMLRFFGVQLLVSEAFVALPVYYLFVTFTPSLGISEAVIRGSWAVVVLQLFTANTAGVVFAAVSVWLINQVLPMLVGSLLKKG